MKRECKAMRVAMYGLVTVWMALSTIGLALFSSWLYQAGGATSLMKGATVAVVFVGCAIALFVAFMIACLFHCKVEERHMELRRMMNVI
ncbi:hypothetical protein IK110_03905 [Candidatus Saccharibacteria bacterium]|nr:hypothetical protein [Candidatus Saccharibacteria bacterium]